MISKRLFAIAMSASIANSAAGGVITSLAVSWFTLEGIMDTAELQKATSAQALRKLEETFPIGQGWLMHQCRLEEIPIISVTEITLDNIGWGATPTLGTL